MLQQLRQYYGHWFVSVTKSSNKFGQLTQFFQGPVQNCVSFLLRWGTNGRGHYRQTC